MEQQGNLFDLHLDQQSVNYLRETARWSRLLSVIGFIYCGLLAIGGLLFGSVITKMMPSLAGSEAGLSGVGGVFLSSIFIILALILFFPAYYLFSFSAKMRRALQNNDQAILTDSLKNLKSFFKFYGILVIIGLSIYGLALISAIIGAMVGSHRP